MEEEKKPRFKSLEFYPPLESEYEPVELIKSARAAWHLMQKDIKFASSLCYWEWQDFPTFVKDVGLPHRPGQVLGFVNPSGRGKQHRYHKDFVYWCTPEKKLYAHKAPENSLSVKQTIRRYPMQKSANLSECRTYRYSLTRNWAVEDLGYAMFIGLNPSTADETADDPTIRRCVSFARSWGYGGLCMTNLFAYRATDPRVLLKQEEPIGPDNDTTLLQLAEGASVVVAAWGCLGSHMSRSEAVKKLIPNLYYLRLTKGGEPNHPLYLPKSLEPIPFNKPTTKRYK